MGEEEKKKRLSYSSKTTSRALFLTHLLSATLIPSRINFVLPLKMILSKLGKDKVVQDPQYLSLDAWALASLATDAAKSLEILKQVDELDRIRGRSSELKPTKSAS